MPNFLTAAEMNSLKALEKHGRRYNAALNVVYVKLNDIVSVAAAGVLNLDRYVVIVHSAALYVHIAVLKRCI